MEGGCEPHSHVTQRGACTRWLWVGICMCVCASEKEVGTNKDKRECRAHVWSAWCLHMSVHGAALGCLRIFSLPPLGGLNDLLAYVPGDRGQESWLCRPVWGCTWEGMSHHLGWPLLCCLTSCLRPARWGRQQEGER